jgi:hypothetical protein
MGKPLSAEHKAKISAALKARNAGKSKSTPTKKSPTRAAAKAPAKATKQNPVLGDDGKSMEGRDRRTMSNAEKTRVAEAMFGTGSKQHKQAQSRWGDGKPAPAKAEPGKPVPGSPADKSGYFSPEAVKKRADAAKRRADKAAAISKANGAVDRPADPGIRASDGSGVYKNVVWGRQDERDKRAAKTAQMNAALDAKPAGEAKFRDRKRAKDAAGGPDTSQKFRQRQAAERAARADKTAKMNAALGGKSSPAKSPGTAAKINADTQAKMKDKSYRTNTDPMAPSKPKAPAAKPAAAKPPRRKSVPPTNPDGTRQTAAQRRAKHGTEAQATVDKLKADGGYGKSARSASDAKKYGMGTATSRRWKAQELDIQRTTGRNTDRYVRDAEKQIAANVQNRKDRIKVTGPDHVEKRRKLNAAEDRKRRYGRPRGEREFVAFMNAGRRGR